MFAISLSSCSRYNANFKLYQSVFAIHDSPLYFEISILDFANASFGGLPGLTPAANWYPRPGFRGTRRWFGDNFIIDLQIQILLQLKFSPRRINDFGLSDGEQLERLWSFLRRFSKMTKEMRPSHRIDVLSDAILHYGRHCKDNLGLYYI